MNKNILFIMFILFGIAVGFGVHQLVLLVSRKVESKAKACTYSCLIGIACIMVLLVVAYLFPIIFHTTGNSVNIGVMV